MSHYTWIVALMLAAPVTPPVGAPAEDGLPTGLPTGPPTGPPTGLPTDRALENPRQPALSQTLQSINDDSRALHDSDLSAAEATRLALHIRSLGERLPALTVGQPGAVRRSAFELDRLSGKLLAAVARGDAEATARESEAIAAVVTRLRAELGS